MRRELKDRPGRRIAIALAVSFGVNAALWAMAAWGFRVTPWTGTEQSSPILVTLLEAPGPKPSIERHETRRVVTQEKAVEVRAAPAARVLPAAASLPSAVRQEPVVRASRRVLVSGPARVLPLTAVGGSFPGGLPSAAPGGGGDGSASEFATPAPVVVPQPVAATPRPTATPIPTPLPTVRPTPTPTPLPATPIPTPTPTPRPVGPTQDAVATNQVEPEIPEALKEARFKASVHVKVEIRADGGFTPSLTSSSGNVEIDRYVLEALRRWRWKPALADGAAVGSVKLFRFDFVVN